MPIEAQPQPPPFDSTEPGAASASIRRERGDGMEWVVVESPAISEFHLTVTPKPGEDLAALAGRVTGRLKSWDATVVRQIVFGSLNGCSATSASLRRALSDPGLPVTWVEGAGCDGLPIAGMQIHAVSGARVRALQLGAGATGRVWRDPVATHCVVQALAPSRARASSPGQAREIFEMLQAGLARAGMDLKDLARTWLFLDDILSWYSGFNRVRTDFFARNELGPGALPASTGIGGRNPAGAALVAAAWAVRPVDPAVQVVKVVPSPCQCPPPSYGSSFSRAVEINSNGFRQLLVSGTASISPDGHTAHVGDIRGQIELTMQVIGAILESRRMSFADVSRATAYFKSAGDQPAFADWLASCGLSTLPVINTCCDICRGDLLFEIEVDAIQAACRG